MKKIIRKQIILITCGGIFIVGFIGLIINYNLLKERFFSELQSEANILQLVDVNDYTVFDDYNDIRISIIDSKTGSVKYDNKLNSDEMDNHYNRLEVQDALMTGTGQSFRFSNTLELQTFYYAINKGSYILRLSKTTNMLMEMVLTYLGLISLFSILVVLVCIFLADYVTDTIIKPINKLTNNVSNLNYEVVYDELLPFVKTIQNQHVDILKAASLRQEFAANVSHELKTPLTVISGYSELMASGMVTGDDTIKLSKDIYHSATILSQMVEDIINLSSLDDSKMSLNISKYNLKTQIEEVVSRMSFLAAKRDVTLVTELTDCIVNLDYNLIQEVLENIIVNAINYNKPDGKVIVSCFKLENKTQIIVKDTGIGISKDDQKRVFERFYRVDKSRSKKTGGTGLGLSIVKHILSQFSATIELNSIYGEGTTIKITI